MGFAGAILTGGASRRMGSDKALLVVNGTPMVEKLAAVLRAAGASSVTAIGGDLERIVQLGVAAVADDHPGEGPLGAIAQAVAEAGADESTVVVVACDLPSLAPQAVRSLVDALAEDERADVAVAVVGGRHQPVLAAWRRSTAGALRSAFASGERSPQRVLSTLRVASVLLDDPAWGRDVDSREDLDDLTCR